MQWLGRSILVFISISTLWARSVPPTLLDPVTAERAKSHLQFLAADSLQGRATLSPSIWKAARYIAQQFREFGLEPYLDSSYFYRYELRRRFLAEVPLMEIEREDTLLQLPAGRSWRPYYFTAAAHVAHAPVVFAGYGVDLPEKQYDAYAGVEVQNAVVVVLDGLPPWLEQQLSKRERRRYRGVQYKAEVAAKKGAAALMVVRLRRNRVRLGGFPWPLINKIVSRRAVPARPAVGFSSIVVVSLGSKAAKAIMGSIDSLIVWKHFLDSTAVPAAKLVSGVRVSVTVKDSVEKIIVPNVVGILRGTQRPEEYIVVGAHFDHLGARRNSKGKGEKQDTIYNGADDNASGTTGVLLLAEAFAHFPQPPKRSILFITFSGEEMGLLGSRAFVNDTTVPVNHFVAMLNMDMISRNHPDTLHVGGEDTAPLLVKMLEEENRQMEHPFILQYDIEAFMGRSDQANFIQQKIPSLFFFTGLHKDYHQVSDEWDKVNFEKLARVARLVGRLLWRVAYSTVQISFGKP